MRELLDGFQFGAGKPGSSWFTLLLKFLCNLTFKGHFSGKGKKSTETGPKTETDPRTQVTRNSGISWERVDSGP